MVKRFHSLLISSLGLLTPAALIAQPVVTGNWYFAELFVGYSNEGGSFKKETGISGGQLSITGSYSNGYSYFLNGIPDAEVNEGPEQFTSFTADTIYRYDTYNNGLETVRTMIHLVSPTLALYKIFDVDYDSQHRIIDLGMDTFILSKTPFVDVNLGTLFSGTYMASEKYHSVTAGEDIALPTTFQASSFTEEFIVGESTVSYDIDQILDITPVTAVEGYSEAFSVLTASSGGLEGEDFLVVQLSPTEVAYGFASLTVDESGFVTFGESGIGTSSAIPEPSSYAALLGGSVLTGTLLRRRRR
jgi:hypothetical protein